MPRQGLTKEKVLQGAVTLMEQKNSTQIEMRELAEFLSVKPASLYNHIAGISQLYHALGELAIVTLTEISREAMGTKIGEEAILAMAKCQREFAQNNWVLYRIYSFLPVIAPNIKEKNHLESPIYNRLFGSYPIEEREKIHLYRTLRSIVHGFIALEDGGYFQDTRVSKEESFQYMLHQFSLLLQTKLKEGA